MKSLPFRQIDRLNPVRVADLNRLADETARMGSLGGPNVVASSGWTSILPPEEAGLVLAIIHEKSATAPYKYAWSRALPLPDGTAEEWFPGRREGYQDAGGNFQNWAADPDDAEGSNPLADGDIVWLKWMETGHYWAIIGRRGADSSFLARLTAKEYTSGEFIAYSWVQVTDSLDPNAVTYTDGTLTGGPGDSPAYHIRNLDLAVGNDALSVVRLRRGSESVESDKGPRDPTQAVTQSGTGSVAWSSVANVVASDDSRVTAALTAGQSTEQLDVTGFGFSFPSDEAITGVLVEIERSRTEPAGTPEDLTVQLLVGGAATGSNLAAVGTVWPEADAYASYGGSGNLWGLSGLTGAQVTATNFGVRIQAQVPSGGTAATARIDHVRITLYYSGGYYLFAESPWEDLFRRTGEFDADGEIAYHRYFDQNDSTWKDGREVRLITAE